MSVAIYTLHHHTPFLDTGLHLCKVAIASRVVEVVINSLVLYGLESIQLTLAEQNCLDAFQMMMLSKILSCTQCNCRQGGTS